MAYKIVVKKNFADKLNHIAEYLETEWSKRVALEFFQTVDERIQSLKYHPYIGAPSRKYKHTRGLSITKHNRLIYKVKGRTVTILNIYDTRQKRYG